MRDTEHLYQKIMEELDLSREIEDEALMEATYAVFDELNGRILRTDERALDLALQLIQVMTDEQPAEYKLEPMASLFQE